MEDACDVFSNLVIVVMVDAFGHLDAVLLIHVEQMHFMCRKDTTVSSYRMFIRGNTEYFSSDTKKHSGDMEDSKHAEAPSLVAESRGFSQKGRLPTLPRVLQYHRRGRA